MCSNLCVPEELLAEEREFYSMGFVTLLFSFVMLWGHSKFGIMRVLTT